MAGNDNSGRSPSRLGRLIRRLALWGFALALLGGMFLAVAVAVTAQSLPGFARLKNVQVGEQMVVVRARATVPN